MPSAVRRMFDGFTSPWATSRPKAWSSASARRAVIQASARSSVRLPRSSREGRDGLTPTNSGRRRRRDPAGDSPWSRVDAADPAAMIQHGRERGTSQERHADELERAVVDLGMRQDLDDVGVPDPGQQPGLSRRPGRDLHDDLTVLEVGLLGQEDPGESPSSQLAAEQVGSDLVAGLGENVRLRVGLGPARAIATRSTRRWMERSRSRRLPMLGKAGEKGLRLGLSTGQFGQAELPVDELDGQPWRRVPSRAR